jgi:Rod binding domain-containing protein
MNPLSGSAAVKGAYDQFAYGSIEKPNAGSLEVRQAFQDFVAGTFYQQMLKSLRKGHSKPEYFHGGSAEEIFQSQLDQQVAEDLAKQHGAAFADPMFEAFARNLNLPRL